MKKILLIFSLLAMATFLFAQNTMTFTTDKPIGDQITAYIIPSSGSSDVWIDLNNNGTKDEGEQVINFGYFTQYTIGSQLITIYGQIREIYLFNNGMTSLNVSGNANLVDLRCSNNKLESIDMSGNMQLIALRCYNNKINKLDLSKNTKIVELFCYENNIDTLDVSNLLYLNTLSCYKNKLSVLKLPASTYSSLQRIGYFSNKIEGENSYNICNSLPVIPSGIDARLVVFDSQSAPPDENRIMKSHVNIALDKNWKVLDYNGGASIPYPGIDDVGAKKLMQLEAKIWSKDGVIFVSDEYNGRNALVYSLNGKLVFSGKITAGVIPTNIKTGIYIISIGNQSAKLYVN